MKSPIMAGLLAALPLAAVFLIYMLFRGKALVAFFQGLDGGIARMSERILLLIIAGFVGLALFFGLISGLVYGWLGMPRFQYLAFGAALVFSVLAVVSRQPLSGDKIVWNLAVGGVLGWMVPYLAR